MIIIFVDITPFKKRRLINPGVAEMNGGYRQTGQIVNKIISNFIFKSSLKLKVIQIRGERVQ